MIARLRSALTTARSPAVVGAALGAALVAGGFLVIGVTWAGASRTLSVQAQVAFLVSGGLGSLALIALGTAIVVLQSLRWLGAAERATFRTVIAAAQRRERDAKRPYLYG
jgi:hypothetical protein